MPEAVVWTAQRIHALGAVTDLPTAGAIFGLSRTTAVAGAASFERIASVAIAAR